jgi:hypothetical protein
MLEVHSGATCAADAQAPMARTQHHPETWALLEGELVRAHRVASDALQQDDIDWLCKGFSAFLASGGRLPLERCLHLPTSDRALRRARRDYWLRRAWLMLDLGVSSWRRSELLASEIQRFHASKWPRWSSLDKPPPGARDFDEALFEAFRSHERVPSTAMQLHNIAGQCRAG